MREIKFRARVKENGKPKLFYQNTQYLNSFLRRVTSFLAFHRDGEGRHESYLGDYELEKSLEQYTGLKDKNGKEIYEGDILKWPNTLPAGYSGDYSYEVTFDDGTFYAQKYLSDLTLSPAHFIEHEIIGNVYENPELLEEQNDEQKN